MKSARGKVVNVIALVSVLVAPISQPLRIDYGYGWAGEKGTGVDENSSLKGTNATVKGVCIENATRWLLNLSVDPLELKDKGMKGKKHFVEKLFALYQLYLHTADTITRGGYRETMRQMCEVTENVHYHLLGDSEIQFKSDIVSYLHACYLMDQVGFASHHYKRYIAEQLPHIKRHMQGRNTGVQMMIMYLLRELGFEIEYSRERLLTKTLINNIERMGTIDVFDFKHNSYMLGVCHEIFVMSEYGRKKIDLFTEQKQDYLKEVMTSSINRIVSSGDLRYLDLLAEMLISLTYLHHQEVPEYKRGIHFIINHQNKNGSFGDYEGFRSHFAPQGVDIDIKWYLHTTEVCLWALLLEDS